MHGGRRWEVEVGGVGHPAWLEPMMDIVDITAPVYMWDMFDGSGVLFSLLIEGGSSWF